MVRLITIGKNKYAFLDEAEALYSKRINRMHTFNITEVKDVKNVGKLPIEERKRVESEKIAAQLQPQEFCIALDEKGKDMSSRDFAKYLDELWSQGKHIAFAIGGAYGFSDAFLERSNKKLRLSSMTFSHEMCRMIFMEQLYRGLCLINGRPYHHD